MPKRGDQGQYKLESREEATASFWARVTKSEGCWVWTGRIAEKGYGHFSNRHFMSARAHRIAYELEVGPVPEGMQLDHSKALGCTTRLCVRPDHLEPVSNKENVRRGQLTKLAADEVAQIRELVAQGTKQADVAALFNISQSQVSRIKNKRRWS